MKPIYGSDPSAFRRDGGRKIGLKERSSKNSVLQWYFVGSGTPETRMHAPTFRQVVYFGMPTGLLSLVASIVPVSRLSHVVLAILFLPLPATGCYCTTPTSLLLL
jgi:hypothetical protein